MEIQRSTYKEIISLIANAWVTIDNAMWVADNICNLIEQDLIKQPTITQPIQTELKPRPELKPWTVNAQWYVNKEWKFIPTTRKVIGVTNEDWTLYKG